MTYFTPEEDERADQMSPDAIVISGDAESANAKVQMQNVTEKFVRICLGFPGPARHFFDTFSSNLFGQFLEERGEPAEEEEEEGVKIELLTKDFLERDREQ